MCVFQEMSQVRRRWPGEAEGFMSLFGIRVILSGVADPATLGQLSLIRGEHEREVPTTSRQEPDGWFAGDGGYRRSETRSLRRERLLRADEIAGLRQGEALVMLGADWGILEVMPWDMDPVLRGVG